MRSTAAFCLFATLFWTVGAKAQTKPPVTVDGGAVYTVQPSTEPSTTDPGYPRPGVGGRAVGFVAGASVPLSSRLGLGVELSYPLRFESVQTSSGASPAERLVNRHRDLIISGLLHLHARPSESRIQFDGVAGLSMVREDTLQQNAEGPPGSEGPYVSVGPQQEIARTTFGVTGGLDLDIPVGRHVSIVPQARLYWISREGPPSGTASALLGLSPVVFRAALGIQASF